MKVVRLFPNYTIEKQVQTTSDLARRRSVCRQRLATVLPSTAYGGVTDARINETAQIGRAHV